VLCQCNLPTCACSVRVLCVTCKIEKGKLAMLSKWQRDFTIDQILQAIKQEMTSAANRKLSQPSEGAVF
jgi:ubiquitin-conjugating enzyme E2 variant